MITLLGQRNPNVVEIIYNNLIKLDKSKEPCR